MVHASGLYGRRASGRKIPFANPDDPHLVRNSSVLGASLIPSLFVPPIEGLRASSAPFQMAGDRDLTTTLRSPTTIAHGYGTWNTVSHRPPRSGPQHAPVGHTRVQNSSNLASG